MKTAIYQPKYPKNYEGTISVIDDIINVTSNNLSDIDLLVLPEYSNCPGMSDISKIKEHIFKYNTSFLDNIIKSAKKNNCIISVNMLVEENNKFFNTTYLINNDGIIIEQYKKTHLSYTEEYEMKISSGNNIPIVNLNGVRYAFATCFELYFPEYFEAIANKNPDIILVPSYQRSEVSRILELQINSRALDSEAFVIRSSYSMGDNSLNGGYSQISSPNGSTILSLEQKVGLFTCEFEPTEKRLRPIAHGLDKMSSHDIVNKFRKPSLYLQSGPLVRLKNKYMYPRVCAHRGFSHACPENTIPAFLAAVAVGADEIEFDLRITKDNKVVICHDMTIDRTTTGTGAINELTLDEIRSFDAGLYFSNEWEGIKVPTLEEVFINCAGLIMFNVHIYDPGKDGWVIKEVARLAKKYNCEDMIYYAGEENVLLFALKLAPHIERACLHSQRTPEIVDYAIKYKCKRLQFFTNVTDETIQRAKEHNIICNIFYADDGDIAKDFIDRGIDTILSNKASKIIKTIK